MPSYQGVPTHACAAGTRYRKYAFSDKDYARELEIRTDPATGRKILLIDGQARTVVPAKEVHSSTFVFEDGL